MELQHTDSQRWKLTLRRGELETLMTAARWILNGRTGRVPGIAREKLQKMLDSFEAECDRLYHPDSKSALPECRDEPPETKS